MSLLIAFLILSMILVACSLAPERLRPSASIRNLNPSPSTLSPAPRQSPLPSTSTSQSTATHTATVQSTPVLRMTKTPEVVKTTTLTPTPQCPELLEAGSPPLLYGGSILVWKSAGNRASGDEIWGFSRKTIKPYEAIQRKLIMDLHFSLSPDGQKLAWLDSKKPRKLIVHDLTTGREQSFPYQDNWKYIVRWVDDHTVSINVETYTTPSKGIQAIYVDYDIQSRSVQTETINLDLPNYAVYPPNPWWGFASLDPKRELVLYTAYEDPNHFVVLRNLQTGQEVWRSENGSASYAPGSWSEAGDKAAFSMMSPDGQKARLFVISRDGKDVQVYTPNLFRWQEIRAVDFSPDGRYVYFAEWRSSSFGPGYLLEVNTGEIRNICTPGYLFGSGWWLPESNQLIYTVRKGDDVSDPGIMELRILDLNFWTTQVLATGANKETKFRFIDWTPIEFP